MNNSIVWKVAFLFGMFGLIMSRPFVLTAVAGMDTATALFLWYAVFAIFLTIVGYTVLPSHWNIRFTIALLIMSWAVGIILYYPVSDYSTAITGAHLTGVEGATEDSVTYSALQSVGINDSMGIITYAVIPAVLTLIAGLVVAPKMFKKVLTLGLKGGG